MIGIDIHASYEGGKLEGRTGRGDRKVIYGP